MGCGSQNSTVTQTSQPPAEYLQAYQNVLGQAQSAASAPLQQYQGQQVQGFTPDQQQAFSTINGAQGAAQPYLQNAGNYLQQATQPLWANTQQYSQGAVNGMSPTNTIGSSPTASGQSPLYSNQSLINPSSYNFSPQQFSGSAISQYESPYTQDVVNATQAQFNNQNAQQSNQLKGSAAAAGAFGGDRHDMAQAALAGQQQLAQAPVIAGLYNQGYSQALGEFNTQQQTGLSAQQAQAQAQLAAQQQGLTQGLQGTSLNQNAFAQGLQQTGVNQNAYGQALQGYGVGLGEFNTQQQQQLSANEANSWLNSQAGFGSMNLASQAQGLPLSAASAQLQSGALQQQLGQEQLNIPYEQFLQQQAYPFQTTSYLANIAEGLGGNAGGTSSSTSPSGNTLSQLGGLGMAGLALNNMGAFSGLGSLFGSGSAGALLGDANGGAITPRKRGGMIPSRGIGGSLPYQDMMSMIPGIGGSGGAEHEGDTGMGLRAPALPDVPNVDVNVVPSGPPAGNSNSQAAMGPHSLAAMLKKSGTTTSNTSGGGGGILGDILGIAKIAMMFAGADGGAVRRDLGGMVPYEDQHPIESVAGADDDAAIALPKVPKPKLSIVPQTQAHKGMGAPKPPAPAPAEDPNQAGQDMLALSKQLNTITKPDLYTVDTFAGGGMVPRRADGGSNDNEMTMDDYEAGPQQQQQPMQATGTDNNFGFTPPQRTHVQPQHTDPSMALLSAGLGMMGGRSGNAFQNIGTGAMAGVKQYESDKAQNLAQADKEAGFDQDFQKNTLSFQEAKARAQQMADDLEQRRMDAKRLQGNSDRDFGEKQKQDAWARQHQSVDDSLRRQQLDQGRYSAAVPGTGVDPASGQIVPGAYTTNTRTGQIDFHPGVSIDKGGANSTSGREAIFTNRIINAGNAAAQSAKNIMELPITSNSGPFGGRGQGPSLLDATVEDLANTATAADAQAYNTMFTGVARNLGALETAGMATQGSLLNSMGGLQLKEGDTQMTKLRKMAEMRQIVDTNLEPSLSNPRIPDEQKAEIKKIIRQIDDAVPFTQHDITAFEVSSRKNPRQTLSDFATSVGLGAVPPQGQREVNKVYPTPKGNLRWTGSGWVKP